MFSRIVLAVRISWAALKWLKQVQANAEERLSMDNVKADRIWCEDLARDLAEGNLTRFSKWLRPLLKAMTLDNTFGRYMQGLLKSERLKAYRAQ